MPLSLPLPLFCSLGCGMCGFFLVDIAAMMHTASHRLKEKKKKEKNWAKSISVQSLQNCESKETFVFYTLIFLSICYSSEKLIHTTKMCESTSLIRSCPAAAQRARAAPAVAGLQALLPRAGLSCQVLLHFVSAVP